MPCVGLFIYLFLNDKWYADFIASKELALSCVK